MIKIMTTKISYLGPKGTYTEEPALVLQRKTGGFLSPELTATLVAKKVASGESDLGVLAYYNLLEGLVQENLDLIYENNLYIIDITRVPIVHSAGVYKESNENNFVYSHPKALAQCSDWITKNQLKCEETASTAKAAEKVNELKCGIAIAKKSALEKNELEIIAEDIGNITTKGKNYTDMYIVSKKRDEKYLHGIKYSTMIAITPHTNEAGLLARKILMPIYWDGVNVEKIHSRPSLADITSSNCESQMFYLELNGHIQDKNLIEAVSKIKRNLKPNKADIEIVRILGSYKKPSI